MNEKNTSSPLAHASHLPSEFVPSPSEEGRLFAHPQDVHCVLFHLLTVLAYLAAFWLYLHPETAGIDSPASEAAFIAAAALMLGWISGINVGVNFHNHAHRHVFRSRWLSRWFGRLWPITGGWPSFFWWYSHVVIHHSHLLGPDDWTLPKRRSDGSFENIYKYALLHWPWRYAVHLWKDLVSGRGGKNVGRRAARELLIFLVLYSIPFWIDPVMGVVLWLLPHWIGNVLIMAPGMYAQHADCSPKSEHQPYGHSNTYLSKFFNLTMFNIGFHIEHHDYPQVHWSDLPEFHRLMKDELLPAGARMLPYGYYRASRVLSPKLTRAGRLRAEQEWSSLDGSVESSAHRELGVSDA